MRASFAAVAANYRTSERHADPVHLRRMLATLAPRGHERVLDVATGGGHTAAALAPFVAEVVAFDLLPEMLHEARTLFREGHVANAACVAGDVHDLPFAEGAFHLVTCRSAPHHFADLFAACAELRRVLQPGGRLYVFDVGAPEDPAVAEWVNDVERTRDPSHVRALSRSEWTEVVERAGLEMLEAREVPTVYDVPAWIGRLNLGPERRAAVLERLGAAPSALPPHVAADLSPGAERFASVRVELIATRAAR